MVGRLAQFLLNRTAAIVKKGIRECGQKEMKILNTNLK
jgi:hypothetical protein